MEKNLHEANRLSWNAATLAHNSHKGDQAEFFRRGGSTLFPEELALLGDMADETLLHLQCNAGQDSLSLARLGARVTGVDISDEAVRYAQYLSRETGIAGEFHRADVYDWLDRVAREGRRFDRVFASYGALCWLSDLTAWARGIARVLSPGGLFTLVEFHPFAMQHDPQWRLHFDYFDKTPIAESGVTDYVAASGDGLSLAGYEKGIEDFCNPHSSYEFFWGLGDVVTALAGAGLTIEVLHEYPYANGWQGFEGMRDSGGRRMVPPEGMPRIPLMYGLNARLPLPAR